LENYEHELTVGRQAAQKARSVLLDHFGKLSQVEFKHQAGMVSEADRAAELAIKTHLMDALPKYGFLGEEEAYVNPTKLQVDDQKGIWVVDPLDGTTNYVHRFPIFCVSIALVINRQPVVGVIDVPILNNTYWARKNHGAFMDGQRLQVSRTGNPAHCLAATGFNAEKEAILNEQLGIFSNIVRKVRGVRRAGSAAFDLCMVASGAFDIFWEQDLSPWDVAAGQLLVDEAGGRITSYEGGTYNPWLKNILATNGHVHDDIVKIISR
jgi:myo-inositol-1(or 4)-monophosphatase